MEQRVPAKDVQVGDRVAVQGGYLARVTKAYPSAGSPIQARRTGAKGVALVIVYQVEDGPDRGKTAHDFKHPEDPVLCR